MTVEDVDVEVVPVDDVDVVDVVVVDVDVVDVDVLVVSVVDVDVLVVVVTIPPITLLATKTTASPSTINCMLRNERMASPIYGALITVCLRHTRCKNSVPRLASDTKWTRRRVQLSYLNLGMIACGHT